MAHGMDVFDAGKHLDKNDPGMPEFFRRLKDSKKKGKKAPPKKDKMMKDLQDYVK